MSVCQALQHVFVKHCRQKPAAHLLLRLLLAGAAAAALDSLQPLLRLGAGAAAEARGKLGS